VKVDIGEVLTRAWQITWKHKVLWGISVLPFLIAFLLFPFWLFIVFTEDFSPDRIEGWVESPTFILVGSLLYVLLIVVSIFLQIMSRSAATLGTFRAEMGRQPVTFTDLLKDGSQYFWRVLGVLLLIGLVVIAFFLVFFGCMAVLSAVTMGIALICFQPLFLLMIPFFLLVMAVMEQAEAAVIADGMSVIDSVKRGYELVWSNLVSYALITIIVYFGINILISFVALPFMIPMFFFMMRNMESGMMDFNGMMRMQAVFGVVILPVMALLQSLALTYLKSAMMVIYLRLTRSPSEPQPVLQAASA